MPNEDVTKMKPADVVIQLIKDKFKDLPSSSYKQKNEQVTNEEAAIASISRIGDNINKQYDKFVSLKLERIRSLDKDGKNPYVTDSKLYNKNTPETEEKIKKEQNHGVFLINNVIAHALTGKGISGYYDFVNKISDALKDKAEGEARGKFEQEKADKQKAVDIEIKKISEKMQNLGYKTPTQASLFIPVIKNGDVAPSRGGK